MSIHVKLNHVTHYRYDRPVTLSPQVVRRYMWLLPPVTWGYWGRCCRLSDGARWTP